MAKFDLSKAEEYLKKQDQSKELEIIPAESMTILPAADSPRGPVAIPQKGVGSQIAEVITSVANPVLGVINTALGTISSVMQSVADITESIQKTKRARIYADMKKAEARQETERVRIHEEELTKRVLDENKAKIEAERLKLEQFRSELELKERNAEMTHEERMTIINSISGTITVLCENNRQTQASLLNGGADAQQYVDTFSEFGDRLVELAKALAAVSTD